MYNNSSLPKPVTRRQFVIRCLVALALATLLADSYLYEPRFPELTVYHVAMPGLPQELDGFRVVQLSDIHRRGLVPDSVIKRSVEMANATHADVVVLTGDYVGKKHKDIDPCLDMLSKLRAKLGRYAVLGNHDHWLDAEAVTRAIVDHGIVLLDNANARVADGLCLVGIDDAWAGRPDVDRAVRGLTGDGCCIMLSHIPDGIELFEGRSGLLLSGHTHGGQVRLPVKKYIPGAKDSQYVTGWYARGNILMYVSRGVGMSILPLRFRCRPEVTLFILHPAESERPVVIPTEG